MVNMQHEAQVLISIRSQVQARLSYVLSHPSMGFRFQWLWHMENTCTIHCNIIYKITEPLRMLSLVNTNVGVFRWEYVNYTVVTF